MVLIKGTEILRQHVQGLPGGTHGSAIDAVAMSGAQNIWPRRVNLGMNCVRRCSMDRHVSICSMTHDSPVTPTVVQSEVVPTLNHLAAVVDTNEVIIRNERKVQSSSMSAVVWSAVLRRWEGPYQRGSPRNWSDQRGP
jgi:hypothetical protein